jgi:SAM-dependent methyltransferase
MVATTRDALGRALWLVEVGEAIVASPRDIRHLRTWMAQRHVSTLDLALPWWPYAAIDAVAAALDRSSRVFEYGSGGSTLWLERRAGYVRSIEHDPRWYEEVRRRVASADLSLVEPASEGRMYSRTGGAWFDDYVATITAEPAASLDLVVVDGRCRVACVEAAMSKVRPGGILLLDDSGRERYGRAGELLRTWTRCDFHGLKPGGAARTTLWTAPADG